MDIVDLKSKTIAELTGLAEELKIPGISGLRKSELIFKILEGKTEQDRYRPRDDRLHSLTSPPGN